MGEFQVESGTKSKSPLTGRRVFLQREPPRLAEEHGQQRLAISDLILHLHPAHIPDRLLRFTYTYGLGGLAILLVLILMGTGVLLAFGYAPSPDEAYASIVKLQTEVWFGQLIRSIHHWCGNLLVVVVFLHMLRVFYTAAFRRPRAFNWLLGLLLLLLVPAASFTGYLLPWDQRSYWAVTVMAGLISYLPVIGNDLRHLLIGGGEVGDVTLRNMYALHIMLVPLSAIIAISFHIWHVRKDRFSIPRALNEIEESPRLRMVTTNPHLVGVELVAALIAIVFILAWSSLVAAPLLAAADPNHPPDPAKAAWYFAGLQELLLHFHPLVSAVVIPTFIGVALIIMPYTRPDHDSRYTGIWFRSRHGRRLAVCSFLVGTLATVVLVLLDEVVNLADLLPHVDPLLRDGYLPLAVILVAIWGYGRWIHERGATPTEVRLARFTLVLAAFITLTVIGNLFRGPGWALMMPWEVFA
jgi:quinol-cytochrome oxidoreductase complex cytochrome b subunit